MTYRVYYVVVVNGELVAFKPHEFKVDQTHLVQLVHGLMFEEGWTRDTPMPSTTRTLVAVATNVCWIMRASTVSYTKASCVTVGAPNGALSR